MPGTTNRYLGQDPILTNLGLAYKNADYVAEEFLPTAPVATQSGKLWIYDRGRFRASTNGGKRAEGANSEEARLNFTLGGQFFCEDHAKKVFVTDEEEMNARVTGRDPYADATEHVTDMQLVDREIAAASILTTTANYASGNFTTLSGNSQWNDYANSNPITAVRAAISVVHSKLFVNVNKILLPRVVFDALVDHPAFQDRIKYTQLGVVTTDLLARVWGVDKVVVAGAGKNTAAAGQADSMSYIWGKHVVLSYVDPSQAEKVLTFGRNYQWKAPIVERLRGTDQQDRRGEYVRRGDAYYDQEIISNEAGYVFRNAIA